MLYQQLTPLPSNSPSHLSIVRRGRDVAATTGPVDMNILAFWIFLVGELRLDAEGVGAEVVALRLKQVGWKILGAQTVVEGQSSVKAGVGIPQIAAFATISLQPGCALWIALLKKSSKSRFSRSGLAR